VLGADPETKTALKQGLGLPLLSFPVVFVNGAFIGGLEQLQDVLASDRLQTLLDAPRQSFPAGIRAVDDPVQLLAGPRGQPWYCFQLHVYGNVIRILSVLHVVAFAIILAVNSVSPAGAHVLLAIMFIDLAIFLLLGPTPVAPICTLVTVFVWRFRGNAVTSLPYKVVIGAAYCWNIGSILTCSAPKDCDTRLAAGVSAMLVNSSFLAFFRF